MRYLIKSTYNPEQANLNKTRKAVIVDTTLGVMAAITAAISLLEMTSMEDEIVRDYLESIGSEDTTEGWSWQVFDNDGVFSLEWRPFEAADPVTIFAFHEWLVKRCKEPVAITKACRTIMNVWHWRTLSWMSEHDLKESLHQIAMEGGGEGYNQMDLSALMTAIEVGPMQAAIDNYDELASGIPFGLSMMVQLDPPLWLH